jgi:DNA topoisomerase I
VTQTISSSDVNKYIKLKTGKDFSAKDFRTWMATYYAAQYLYHAQRPVPQSGKDNGTKEFEKLFVAAATYAASHLGNTPKVCRDSYIHPMIFETYKDQARFENAFSKDVSSNERALVESAVLKLIN